MKRFAVSPEALRLLDDALEQAGHPRLLARRTGLFLHRFHDAADERGELFPELPTWLRLARARAREARIPRQEAQVRLAALRLLGDPQAAEAWVSTPWDDFGGRTPLRMAQSEGGVTKVHVLVARLERERAAGRKE